MAAEFLPKVAEKIRPLRCLFGSVFSGQDGLVAPVAARRHDLGDHSQVQLDDDLQGLVALSRRLSGRA
jgi:hypothetical protein